MCACSAQRCAAEQHHIHAQCSEQQQIVTHLPTKRDTQRVCVLWHDELRHMSQSEIWTDTVFLSRHSLHLHHMQGMSRAALSVGKKAKAFQRS